MYFGFDRFNIFALYSHIPSVVIGTIRGNMTDKDMDDILF